MKKDNITTIIPVYNAEQYLEECLESIENQIEKFDEVILINDGSTDNSLKICEKYCKRNNYFRLINQENQGQAKARNVGIKQATGNYIIFIDSDDYIENSMIETLLKSIKQTNADVCECSFFIHMKNGVVKDVTCEQKGVEIVEDQLDLVNAYSD